MADHGITRLARSEAFDVLMAKVDQLNNSAQLYREIATDRSSSRATFLSFSDQAAENLTRAVRLVAVAEWVVGGAE